MSLDIIRAEFTLFPVLVDSALVIFINSIHNQSQDRISHQAFEASQSFYESDDISSWYNTMASWLLQTVETLITYLLLGTTMRLIKY